MFPEIIKKKKIKIGTQQMRKQCQFVLKQLDFKHRKAQKSLPSQLVSDFHKVCHLKDIPSFYWQYFFYFVSRASKEDVEKYFAQEVENIMLTKSYYHKIQSLLRERQQQLSELKQQMQIVEGFAIMNSGKQLPMTVKGKINALINNCSSLDQLKSIESTQVSKITTIIIKLRDNLKGIIENVISWQFWLRSFHGNESSIAVKKMKIIFSKNGVNCIFIGLFDLQFIKSSFLNQEIKFSNSQQYDPFLTEITAHKKISKIFNQYLFLALNQNKEQYQKVQRYLFDCIPLAEIKQNQGRVELKRASTSEKKFQSVQRPTSKKMRRSSKGLVDEFVSAKLINEKDEMKMSPSQITLKQINIDKISSIYKKKSKIKNSSIGKQQGQNVKKSLHNSRHGSIEQKQIVNLVVAQQQKKVIDLRSNRKSIQSQKQQLTHRQRSISMSKTLNNNTMKRIQNVYKLSSSPNIKKNKKGSIAKQISSIREGQIKEEYVERVLRQKEQLIKQLKIQKKEQQNLKKIIRQGQNRSSAQYKSYQQKNQYYQKEIQTLKLRIKNRQQGNQQNSIQHKTKQSSIKKNQLISKVYQQHGRKSQQQLVRKQQKSIQNQKQKQKQKQSPEWNLAKSQLVERNNMNKMLQDKIKLLGKQKRKLQELIQKQGTKINKQKEMYERKLEKYQQIIQKLKSEVGENMSIAFDNHKKYSLAQDNAKKQQRQLSIKRQKQKQQKIMKLYSKRQSVMLVSPQKQSKKRNNEKDVVNSQLSSNKNNQGDSNNIENEIKQQKELRITNSHNTIQIVFNPNKNKNKNKQKQIQIQTNNNNLNENHKQSLKQQLSSSQIYPQSNKFQSTKNNNKLSSINQITKQKSIVQRKLDLLPKEKSTHEILLMKKLQQTQLKFQKYKSMMEKQKSTTIKYDQRMKQMRTKINSEYQQKITNQRQRFIRQKQRLLERVKQQKQSKIQKDRYLSRQILFLKQMQSRERELVGMLQSERREREERERVLEEEIGVRQEMIQKYQLEEIRRVIEKQVREEMNLLGQSEEDNEGEQYQEGQQQQKQQGQQKYKENNNNNIIDVEKEILQNTKQNRKKRQFSKRKQQLQQQMREMMENTQLQLQQMDQQNQRLKQLIQSIRQQENKVIMNLHNDLQQQDQEEGQGQQQQLHKNVQRVGSSVINDKNIVNQQQQLQVQLQDKQQQQLQKQHYHQHQQQLSPLKQQQLLKRQLKQKSLLQLQKQHLSKSTIKHLQQSAQYKQRQKLQNIIQQYLQKPKHYPNNNNLNINNNNNKNTMLRDNIHHMSYNNNNNNQQQQQPFLISRQQRLINSHVVSPQQRHSKMKQFQHQLMQLKNVQNYIPAQRDDPVMGHLLHLRQQYQNQQAQQLRKVLFPSLNDDQNNDYDNNKNIDNNYFSNNIHELSFQSQQPPPPVTLRDHNNVHQQEYLRQKKQKKYVNTKNFMAINRIKLMQIQQQKKQKQRLMVEEQARKKIKKIRYKSKKKQEKQLEEFNVLKQQMEQKYKKRQEEIQRGKKGNNKNEQQQMKKNKQQMKRNKSKRSIQVKQQKSKQSSNKNKISKQRVQKQQRQVDKISKKKSISQKNEIVENKDEDKSLVKKQSGIQQKQVSQQQNEFLMINNDDNDDNIIVNVDKCKQNNVNKQGIVDKNNNKQSLIDNTKGEFEFIITNDDIVDNKDKVSNEHQKEQQLQQQQDEQYGEEQFEDEGQQQQSMSQLQLQLQRNEFIMSQNNNKQSNNNNQPMNILKQQLAEMKNNQQHKNDQGDKKPLSQQQQQQQQQKQQLKQQQQQHQQHQSQPIQLTQQQSPQLLAQQYLLSQKQSLKQDILSYQSQIRSYISAYTQYNIYQHYIEQQQLSTYLKSILQLSSQQIIALNNNPNIIKDVLIVQAVLILIAKDKQTNLQIGIGVFHKQHHHHHNNNNQLQQHHHQEYFICDYLLSHNMNNFLPLVFNLTKHTFLNDHHIEHVEFIFTDTLQQQQNKLKFYQFQEKLKRLGEIYVKKGKLNTTKKYILKRELFVNQEEQQEQFGEVLNEINNNQPLLIKNKQNNTNKRQQQSLFIQTRLHVHQNVIKLIKHNNDKNILKQQHQQHHQHQLQQSTSPTFILSLYLKNNPTILQSFRTQIEQNLKYRQLLLTSIIFTKKEFVFKPVIVNSIPVKDKIDLYNKLGERFQIEDKHQNVQELMLQISQQCQYKRCVLQINQQNTNYCMFTFTEPLNKCQTGNSSQTGIFLPIIPKYKLLIIPAHQFLTLSSTNPDMNVFFYTKHFIKNITEVKKENVSRVFLPQIKFDKQTLYQQLSLKIKKTIIAQNQFKLGYQGQINNSVIYKPRHNDIVIQKPFIVAILSANVERTVQGSPVFCTLID